MIPPGSSRQAVSYRLPYPPNSLFRYRYLRYRRSSRQSRFGVGRLEFLKLGQGLDRLRGTDFTGADEPSRLFTREKGTDENLHLRGKAVINRSNFFHRPGKFFTETYRRSDIPIACSPIETRQHHLDTGDGIDGTEEAASVPARFSTGKRNHSLCLDRLDHR